MKILVVDDNKGIREVIKNILEDKSAEFCECQDAASALALYRLFEPEWVLMDIEMDGMDGIAATREILRAHKTARVIIVTNYDEPHFREAASSAGAVAFVCKERLHELAEIVNNDDK